jgi:hypothetical protein
MLAVGLAAPVAYGQVGAHPSPDSAAVRDSLLAGAEAGRLAARRWAVGWYAIGGLVGGFQAGGYGMAFAAPNYPEAERPRILAVSLTHVGLLALLRHHASDVVLPDSIRRDLDARHAAYREGFEDAYRRELPPRRRRVMLRSSLIGAAVGAGLYVLISASAPYT